MEDVQDELAGRNKQAIRACDKYFILVRETVIIRLKTETTIRCLIMR